MVGNRISFILFCWLICSSSLFGSMTLGVGGGTQYEAVLGEVFTVDLVIKDVPKGFPDPIIENVPHGSIQRAGLYMSTINGKSEIRYSYRVQFDQIGSYTIGPATIIHNGNKLQSNQLFVSVSHGKQEPNEMTKQDLFLRLTVDTDLAVVGQLITCTLSCYVKRRGITIERIIPPRVTKAELSNQQKSHESHEIIDGVQYTVLSWTWQVIPTSAGELVIPAAAIEYTSQTRNRSSFLFSLFSESQRMYSNACTVQIAPLPHYSGICHAVGQFSKFSSSLSPTIIKQGEATTITLILEGKGTFIPRLQYDLSNMPDAVRYYAVDPKQHGTVYTFEFIAQGIKEGIYTIPEQTFTFFNTDSKQYEQLHTTVLELHITENNALQPTQAYTQNDMSPPEDTMNANVEKPNDNQQEMQSPENVWFAERFLQSSATEINIPFAFMIVLILAMVLFKMGLIIFPRSELMHVSLHRIGFKIRVFVAHWRLRRIARNNDVRQLHQLFIWLIGYLYECPENDVYLFIPDFSGKLRYTSGTKTTFEDFWASVARAVYTEHKQFNQHELYKQAKQWIQYIGQVF